jgi:hypothetical protein
MTDLQDLQMTVPALKPWTLYDKAKVERIHQKWLGDGVWSGTSSPGASH